MRPSCAGVTSSGRGVRMGVVSVMVRAFRVGETSERWASINYLRHRTSTLFNLQLFPLYFGCDCETCSRDALAGRLRGPGLAGLPAREPALDGPARPRAPGGGGHPACLLRHPGGPLGAARARPADDRNRRPAAVLQEQADACDR